MVDRYKDRIKSIDTTLDILETIRHSGRGNISEISERTGQTKSTVHRHLNTLRDRGYVVKDGNEYAISLKMLRLSSGTLDRHILYSATKSVINDLAEETGESAATAVEENGEAVYLYYNRTDQAIRTDARVGIRLYLHCTGAGKALLAHLPADQVDAIIDDHGLPEKTSNTITDRDTLEEELQKIRNTGIAFDNEERVDGMRGVATPIQNRETGELLGAITVAGPTRRISDDRFRDEIPTLLKDTAKMVEVNITYS
ncbi:IclR family transcriptional regulator [Natronorubrum halophilum]|uniref:IclR family transcriptional regulator n=1 Tax=Natronorubrum halophilum TaxID=1702106 RepID=UPI0013CE968E|nr:IclR family transcriptional regulator [Natronorubrum halophilum]